MNDPASIPSIVPVDLSAFRASRCVVTGGLGFIGSNLAVALAASGANVSVIDALVPQHGGDRRNLTTAVAIDVSSRIEVVECLISREKLVAPVIAEADVVFNCAGQVSHIESMTDPLRDLNLNARDHLAFLEIVRRVNPSVPLVQTSTRQVYGRPRYLPVDEDHPTAPVDINGIDKLAGEQFHILYHTVHGLRTSALRLTNVYGPRQCLTKDGLGFLPVFVRRAINGLPISVYGDGSQLRDCLHVNDVVRALAACALSGDAAGQVFNLGHPEALGLIDIARATVTAAASGREARRSEVGTVEWPSELAAIDIGSFQGDYSKAKRVLGWEPTITFADGIAETIRFYGDHRWYLSPDADA